MSDQTRIGIIFFASACIAVVCTIWLLLVPSDAKNALVFGFSASRLLLLGVLISIAVFFSFVAWKILFSTEIKLVRLAQALKKNDSYLLFVLLLFLFAIAYLIFIPNEYLGRYESLYQRVFPFFAWLFATFLLFVAHLSYLKLRESKDFFSDFVFQRFFFALFFFLSIWLFIAITGMGIGTPQDFWSRPTSPILWPQVILSFFAAFLIVNFFYKFAWFNYFIYGLIIATSILLWQTQDYLPGTFSTHPVAPTYQIYPFSDAELFDTSAHRLRSGHGMDVRVADKSLYIAYLAILHTIAQGNYGVFYFIQVSFFSLIPISGYWLGKEIYSKHLGLAFAIILIFKEKNNIALTNYLSVSTSKMILSEPLTMLGVLLFSIFFVKWLKRPELSNTSLWIAGGWLGITCLIRLNAATILPFCILLIGMAVQFRLKKWLYASLIISFFTVITMSPWIMRSAVQTGNPFHFIQGKTHGVILNNRYQPVLESAPESHQLQESVPESHQPVQDEPTATSPFYRYIEIGNNIIVHYARNLFCTAILLPPTLLQYSLFDIIRLPYFKMEWHGTLTIIEMLVLFSTLGISAFGVAVAQENNRHAGLAPLFIALGYNLSTAIAFTSGGRYAVPFEWVLVFYYFCGWVGIAQKTGYLKTKPGDQINKNRANFLEGNSFIKKVITGAKISVFFMAIGGLPALMEVIIPPRYHINPSMDELSHLIDLEQGVFENENLQVWHGLAIYPRFYKNGEGLTESPESASIVKMPYDRLTFQLVGPGNDTIILPIGSLPDSYPSMAEAWVIGERQSHYIEASIIVIKTSTKIYQLSACLHNECKE